MTQQRLQREATVLTGVFTTLKQQLETIKIEEVKESNYVIMVDPPNVPIFRSKPKKKLMVLLALILGIILSFLLSIIKTWFRSLTDEQVKKYNEVKNIFRKNIIDLIYFRFWN